MRRGGYTLERIERLIFDLGYKRHGGSGLSYGYAEVREMPFSDILAWTRMLDDRLSDEVRAIRAANRQR